MPELPEVETIVQELKESCLEGLTIIKTAVIHPQVVEGDLEEFCKNLNGKKIISISRKGKYILFALQGGFLTLHLRMTGKLFFIPPTPNHLKHIHLKLKLSDDRTLYYEDPRRFGRFNFSKDFPKQLKALGLEPLSKEFTLKKFKQLLRAHKGQIKPFLLNQRYIAGLGNIYVDEALFEAKVHPQCPLAKITDDLYYAIIKVLKNGIAFRGTTLGKNPSNYLSLKGQRGENEQSLKVFGKEGKPCPRCKEPLIKIKVRERGTHLCPQCQFLPE